MIDYLFTIGMVVASGVGFVALRRWIKRTLGELLYGWSRRWHTLVAVVCTLMQALVFLGGIILLELAFDARNVDDGWSALLVLAPGLCDLWAGLRWKAYGQHRAEQAWEAYCDWEQRRDRAIHFLEGQGFSIECLQENVYGIHHQEHEVSLLRGVKEGAELIQIADQLYPLLLHQQIKGEPTEVVLLNFGHGPAFNPN